MKRFIRDVLDALAAQRASPCATCGGRPTFVRHRRLSLLAMACTGCGAESGFVEPARTVAIIRWDAEQLR